MTPQFTSSVVGSPDRLELKTAQRGSVHALPATTFAQPASLDGIWNRDADMGQAKRSDLLTPVDRCSSQPPTSLFSRTFPPRDILRHAP